MIAPSLAVAEEPIRSEALPETDEPSEGQDWTESEATSESTKIPSGADFESSEPIAEPPMVLQSEQLARHTPPTPHYWRTLLELSATIGIGTAWYWINEERQVADWDYPSWRDKLTFDTDIMIFDNNDFEVNYTWHTFAGGSSHLLGRSNGLGIYQSFAFGTLASVFWEYGIEARELISLNDLLVTNTTGLPTGEFFHRVAQYVNQGQQGVAWDVARWTVGLGHTGHAAYDGKPVSQDLAITPDFRMYYSLESADSARQDGDATRQTGSSLQHTVGFDGRIVALDSYLRPGRTQEWFGAANFTDFSISHSRGEGYATRAESNALLAGWRHQNIPEKGQGGIGTGLTLATSVGYRYQREEYGLWRDLLGGLHFPGVAVEGELLGDQWKLRAQVHTSVDLMGINSLSWQQFQSERPDELGKSILQNTGYYYGYGVSTRAETSLEISRFTLGASLFAASYTSIEGYDRLKATLEMEASGDDTFVDYELSLRAKLYQDSYAQARWGQSFRDSSLNEYEANQKLNRANLELGLQF